MCFPAFVARKKSSQWYRVDTDASIKGAIDEGALPILNILNAHARYLSTSSCAGRVLLWADESNTGSLSPEPAHKENGLTMEAASAKACDGKWLHVTHDRLHQSWPQELAAQFEHVICMPTSFPISTTDSDPPLYHGRTVLYLKMEPYLLHIEAADAAAGQALLQVALQAGYRNSGLTLTKKRCIVAIRSTLKLDAPIAFISDHGRTLQWLVAPDYLVFLTHLANEKMRINEAQRQRLLRDVAASFSA